MKVHKSTDAERAGLLHLIVKSTELKLCGAGEWLLEKNGTTKCLTWRKLNIGIDADSGGIVASDLIHQDVDDASLVELLLDQLIAAPASFMADGAYDRIAAHDVIIVKNLDALLIVPPCKGRWRARLRRHRQARETSTFSTSLRTGARIGRKSLVKIDAQKSRPPSEATSACANLDNPTSSASGSRDRAGASPRLRGPVREESPQPFEIRFFTGY